MKPSQDAEIRKRATKLITDGMREILRTHPIPKDFTVHEFISYVMMTCIDTDRSLGNAKAMISFPMIRKFTELAREVLAEEKR